MPENSTCKALKQKWQCVLEVLQLAMDDLDSLDMLVGRCLKYLWTKRTMEFGYGLKFAELALFCSKTGILCTRRFWRQKGRVYGLLGAIKLVYNVCVSWFLQMWKMACILQVSSFSSKSVCTLNAGLSKPYIMLHTFLLVLGIG